MVAKGSRNTFYSLTPERLFELLKDNYSLVKVIKKDLTLPMAPSTLDKVVSSLHKIIKYEWTYKYSIELQGILLYHDELEFKSDLGYFKDDNPNIFWEISANFYVFTPEVGAIVRGKVNKFSKSHVINALVLDCIIAALTSDKIHSSLKEKLVLGQDILFKIDSFDGDNSLIYGSIDEECLSLMESSNIFVKKEERMSSEREIATFEELYKS